MDVTPAGLLAGGLALVIGLALVFKGFKLFVFLLPALGFLGGLLLGVGIVEELFGGGFLATLGGWTGGLLLGVVFAALSYLYYWFAVGILGGVIGYQLTLGLLAWIGVDASGVIAMTLGFIVGLVFGVGFLLLRMPIVVAIVGTAIVGAGATAAGVVVALGLIPAEQLRDGIFGVYSSEDVGWIAVLAIVALALGGMVFQARELTDDDAPIGPDAYRNPGIGQPGGPAPA
jgi:hypothetical protein